MISIIRSAVRSARRRLGRTASPPAGAAIHPEAVIYETARLQFQGRPETDIAVGRRSHIRGELLLFGHGGRIRIGDYCYVGEGTRIWSSCDITVGDRVLISHLCTVMDNLTHPLGPSARHAQFRAIIEHGHPARLDLGERPVRIEDDALVGCQSVILRGVTIGRGAIVGAGSVVTGDVPAYTIVAGNPARHIRELTAEERL